MDNEKLIQEIKKPIYTDLRLTNIYFNAIYKNILHNGTDEEIIIKLIASLCENIEKLMNKRR
jgi:hypothetical protein